MHPIISITGRGQVLDANLGAMLVPVDAALDVQPFTIELWAQPRSTNEWLVTARLPRFEKSWALTVGGDGDVAAFFAANDGQWFWNQRKVVDGRWHHIAMTYDGKWPAFFVDGQPTKLLQSDSNQGRKFRQDEGLQVGSTAETLRYFNAEALIQEVRLSRGVRAIPSAPGRLEIDDQTVALWRMDRAGADGVVANLAGPTAAGRLRAMPADGTVLKVSAR